MVSEADKMFVAKVSQGGMFEVEASKVANDKATQQDVIDTSVTEVHDHQLVGDKLKSIAGTLGLPFPTELNSEFKTRLEKLKSLSGKAFDDAYIEEMDAIHAIDVEAFAEQAKTGKNQALKDFAGETVLIVRRHIGSLHAVPLPSK
jgi:putative membrane protein